MLDEKNQDLPQDQTPENEENRKISDAENAEVVKEVKQIEKDIAVSETTKTETKKSFEKKAGEDSSSESIEEKELEKEVPEEEVQAEIKDPAQEVAEESNVESKVESTKKEQEKESEPAVEDKKELSKKDDQIPSVDFSVLSIENMLTEFENLVLRYSANEIKNAYFSFKKSFEEKYKAFYDEQKEAYLAEGGDESEFDFSSPFKAKFRTLSRTFKKKRQEAYLAVESEKKENLEKKLALIERLKDLIDNAEPSSMYKDFKDLQAEWRSVGQIPRVNYNDVWQTYQHHVERFYDLLHLSNEFKDLDFKHNLEEKNKLVERAEELAKSKDVEKAFRELQVLHRMWKEEIGPVAREFREEVWHKFSEATKKIHEKRHDFQKDIEKTFEKNEELKLEVIEKIKNLDLTKLKSHGAWQETMRKVEAYRKEFMDIGRVTRAKNEEIWSAFKEVTRNFNREKNNFFKSIKSEQLDNLKKKMELVEQAESLKDSDDWDSVTDIFKKIQSDWKKIGHVPKRDSDKIWHRFKDACNHYFDRLHQKKDGINKEQIEIFDQKKELLGQFKEDIKQEEQVDIDAVNHFVDEWRSLGELPNNMGHLNTKFNKVLDSAYKKMDIEEDDAAFLKFKNIVDSYLAQNDTRKLESEHHFVRKKCDELTREVKQLENNVSFISNASADNPLVQNVLKNIESHKDELKIWTRKLKYMNNLDY